MTVNDMHPAVGQTAMLRMEDLQIEVTIRDVKTAYGRVRLLVEPVAGTGRQWVELGRLTLAAPAGAVEVRPFDARDVREMDGGLYRYTRPR